MISLFFPKFCIGCGFVGAYLCNECFEKIPILKNNKCVYCGKGGVLGLTHIKCKKTNGVDGCTSFYKYSSLVRNIIIYSKYNRSHLILSDLLKASKQSSYETVWKWKKLFNPTIVPVPLHQRRELERGFNQSEIIANHIANYLNLPLKRVLTRIKNTEHLANIKNNNTRRVIIKNAFQYVGEGVPKATLLIDDVITTTATIGECTKILKRSGVETVLSFSLAK